jgi:DNA-binding response OmpR family regulator
MANFLIIDDDPILIKVLKTRLATQGHSSVAATDAFDALEKIKQELFDLVICDANLPGRSGFEVIQTIRADEKFMSIPVLFLTGRRSKKDVMRALDAGVDDYMIKPVDFDLFFAKIEALLRSKPAPQAFADCLVNEPAAWNLALNIIGVSEQGLTFRSAVELPADMKLQIESALFSAIGLEAPPLRITTTHKESAGWVIKAVFVGLNSLELKRIRMWIAANHRKNSRRVS